MDKGNGEQTSNGNHLPKLTEDLRTKFFAALADTCNITKSAQACGLSRQHVHYMRRTDREFARRWEDAIEQATDALEYAARQRGKDGYQDPIYQGGKLVGHRTVYSDRMAEILLKAHRRDKFGDKGFDLPPGSEIVISMRTGDGKEAEPIDVTPMPDKPETITD